MSLCQVISATIKLKIRALHCIELEQIYTEQRGYLLTMGQILKADKSKQTTSFASIRQKSVMVDQNGRPYNWIEIIIHCEKTGMTWSDH